MEISYTRHAREQMERRQITPGDVESALRRQTGNPEPGLPGTIWIRGMAAGGRILRVCVGVENRYHVITAAWPSQTGGLVK